MAQSNLSRAMAYLEKLPPAISGSGGHDATLRAACECFRFGLSTAEALDAMRWYNANRCKPAWTEKELAHKLADAEKMTTSEFGKRVEGRNFSKRKSRTFQPPRAITQFAPPQPARHGALSPMPTPDDDTGDPFAGNPFDPQGGLPPIVTADAPITSALIAERGLVVTARDGNRLTLAAIPQGGTNAGESLFDKLTSQPDPIDRSQWPALAQALAAAAIREHRYGDGWPLAEAEDWRQWAAKFGPLPELPPMIATALPPIGGNEQSQTYQS
ncbi:MAG: hypothetical protein HYZ49_08585 [Chloroflexi bacterium]|nr:hypothetical protein [Chloroflexota bacterium]